MASRGYKDQERGDMPRSMGQTQPTHSSQKVSSPMTSQNPPPSPALDTKPDLTRFLSSTNPLIQLHHSLTYPRRPSPLASRHPNQPQPSRKSSPDSSNPYIRRRKDATPGPSSLRRILNPPGSTSAASESGPPSPQPHPFPSGSRAPRQPGGSTVSFERSTIVRVTSISREYHQSQLPNQEIDGATPQSTHPHLVKDGHQINGDSRSFPDHRRSSTASTLPPHVANEFQGRRMDGFGETEDQAWMMEHAGGSWLGSNGSVGSRKGDDESSQSFKGQPDEERTTNPLFYATDENSINPTTGQPYRSEKESPMNPMYRTWSGEEYPGSPFLTTTTGPFQQYPQSPQQFVQQSHSLAASPSPASPFLSPVAQRTQRIGGSASQGLQPHRSISRSYSQPFLPQHHQSSPITQSPVRISQSQASSPHKPTRALTQPVQYGYALSVGGGKNQGEPVLRNGQPQFLVPVFQQGDEYLLDNSLPIEQAYNQVNSVSHDGQLHQPPYSQSYFPTSQSGPITTISPALYQQSHSSFRPDFLDINTGNPNFVFTPSTDTSDATSLSSATSYGNEMPRQSSRLMMRNEQLSYHVGRNVPLLDQVASKGESESDSSAEGGMHMMLDGGRGAGRPFTPDASPHADTTPRRAPANVRAPTMGNTSRAPSAMMMDLAMGQGGDEEDEEMDYETARQANIRRNEMLLEGLGLGGGPLLGQKLAPPSMNRKPSNGNFKGNPAGRKSFKDRVTSMSGPTRASPRIASMSRRISYAHLDDGNGGPRSHSGESYSSGEYDEDEDDWEGESSDGGGSTRGKNRRRYLKRSNAGKERQWGGGKTKPMKRVRVNDPTLRDLVEDHPEVRDVYPLFYHTCTPDMLINNDAFPLIGSIPSTCSPVEKAEQLKGFFHKGRRCIAQLDAFTARCDKKYEGPGQAWEEIDYQMKISIRDIRRKGVERCENYKYTRRDILNRAVGKGKWEAIEDNWIPWTEGDANKDPAGDLAGHSLPSPPPRPARPAPPRPDPLMVGLDPATLSRAPMKRVKQEVMYPGNSNSPARGSRQPHEIAEEEESDGEDDEEDRLDRERQQRLAIQRSQQRYASQYIAPPVQQPYGMYSAVRGGEASPAVGAGYGQQQQGFSVGSIPIPGANQGFPPNVEIPMSSQSTHSHPMSSVASHHEMMEQNLGFASGGIDMDPSSFGILDGQMQMNAMAVEGNAAQMQGFQQQDEGMMMAGGFAGQGGTWQGQRMM